MKNHAALRRQFLQDPLPTRLVHLAANLQRIIPLLENKNSTTLVELIDECRRSIEWSAPELLPDRIDNAAYLVEVQRELTRWQHIWQQAQSDPAQRQKLAEQAREWSIEILYISGLVDE